MKIGELFVEIGAKLDNFNKGMSDVEKAMQNIGRKLSAVGKQLTMKVTLPIVALGGASVKAFADFDKAMVESTAIMGKLSKSTKKDMADLAKTISTQTTFSAKELAQAYFYLASAGMDAQQSMKVLGDVARFAQAGTFDLSTATDLLTDAQSALGLSSKNAATNQKNLARVGDVLVKANTLANATVQQFSEALTSKAGPALRFVNKEVEEGVAVMAAYADQGVKGSLAGEALNIVLRDLQRAAIKNKKAFKEAGVAVFDAQGNMRNMADIIQDLEKYLGDMTTEQKKAALSMLGIQERSQAYTVTLIGTSEKIREYERELRKAGGTTKDVSDKQLQSFSNRMKVLKNRLTNVAIELGEKLAPIVEKIAVKIEKAAKWFSNLSDSTKETIIQAGLLLAALGPVLSILGKILIVVPKLGKAFKFLAGSPTALLIAGLASLALAAKNATKKFKESMESYREEMDKTGRKISWLSRVANSSREALEMPSLAMEANIRATRGFVEMQKKADGIMSVVKGTAWLLSDGIKFLGDKFKELTDLLPKTEEKETALNNSIKTTAKLIETELRPGLVATGDIFGYFTGKVIDANEVLGVFEKKGKKAVEVVSDAMEEQGLPAGRSMVNVLDAVGVKAQQVAEKTKSAWQEVSTAVYDLSRKWADTLGDTLGIAEWFYAEAKEFDDSHYKSAIENIENIYEATKNKLDQQLTDQNTYYNDIMSKAKEDYEKKRKLIEDSVDNEEKKQAMLATLEDQHQVYLENVRRDQLDAEKTAREDALELESTYQKDLEAIREEEAIAMDEHRKSELEKQKSVWNQLKKAFGEVIEDLVKLWATKFIGGIINSLFDSKGEIAGAVKDVASKAIEGVKGVAKGIGNVLSTGLATGIGSFAGNFLANMLKGKEFGSTEKWHLEHIWKNTQNLITIEKLQHEIRDHALRIAVQTEGIPIKLDCVNRHLEKIREYTEVLSKIKFAQHGVSETVNRPTLYMAGEKGAERVNITPIGRANFPQDISIESTPVNIYLDSQQVGLGIIKHFPKFSKGGLMHIHERASKKF